MMLQGKWKEYYSLLIAAAVLLALVLNLTTVYEGIQNLLSMFSSVFIGAILAFILNVPMKRIEGFCRAGGMRKGSRALAIVLTLIMVVFILAACVLIIIPNFSKTMSQLIIAVETLYMQLEESLRSSHFISGELLNEILQRLQAFASVDQVVGILSKVALNTGNIFSNVFSWFFGLFFMVNFLAAKEHLQSIVLRLLGAFLPDRWTRLLCYVGRISIETYDRFLSSKLIEAFIIGMLLTAAYALFRLPYGGMVGILAGILSFIPYVGSLTAMLVGALFIFVDSPMQALISMAVFQGVQFVEDNVIYPRVVGQSVGLPPLFTLAAASIGGAMFGILGMVFFTPIFAVIYRLCKEAVEYRLAKKSVVSEEE